jgi:high affinity sulfate transporter 1
VHAGIRGSGFSAVPDSLPAFERRRSAFEQLPMSDQDLTAIPSDRGRHCSTPWLPGVATARRYRSAWLRPDVVAGLVLAALLVPQGMAYAQLAGLPPVMGIYATLVPLLVYALAGPSRIMIVGPDSAVSPLIAAALIGIAASGTPRAAPIAALLAVVVGITCVIAGLCRLGVVTELFSRPVRIGYLNGLGLTIIVRELPGLLGFSVRPQGFPQELADVVKSLGATEAAAAAIGVGCLAVLLTLRRRWPRVPAVPIAVVLATLAVVALDLGVPVVGTLPAGLPTPSLPHPGPIPIPAVVAAAIGIALVAFADTGVLSRSYAHRLNEDVDQSRELVALGLVNLGAGLFQGFPVSTSGSRTAVAEASGAKTQAAGIVAAGGIAAVLVGGRDLMAHMPEAALAAIVIFAALALLDVEGMALLARARASEFALAVACLAGVLVVGVLQGIFIAVGLSLLDFVRRAWRPHDAVLGRVNERKGYHDLQRHPEARRIPGMIIYRFDSPLFFANADYFSKRISDLVAESEPPIRRVLVAAEPITDIDTTAAETLVRLRGELAEQGVKMAFAELKGPVRDRLERYGVLGEFDPRCFYPTLGVAVHDYVKEDGVEWEDWTTSAAHPAASPGAGHETDD